MNRLIIYFILLINILNIIIITTTSSTPTSIPTTITTTTTNNNNNNNNNNNEKEKEFALAVINYRHLKSNMESIRKNEEKKLWKALTSIGFLIITNHGIDKDVMDRAWNQTQLFFDTSKENKLTTKMTKDYMYGYSADEILSRSETKDGYGLSYDQKETFQAWIGAPFTNRDQNVKWPPLPIGLKDAWTDYYRACEKLVAGILESVARLLKIPDNWFEDKIDDHMSALRALNYPQQDKPPPVNSIRCSPHSDYGTFTLLRQDGIGGLQVDRNGTWHDVISDYYDFVVNVGDLMQRWTNDRFKSTRHRVINADNFHRQNRRQSMAFFGNPNANAIIETFESCLDANGKSKYPPITFLQFLENKHHATQTHYEYQEKSDL